MPQWDVNYILAWKRDPINPYTDSWETLSPEHRKMREQIAAMGNKLHFSFEEFQREVRSEVEKTGRYMIDDSYYSNQDEMQAQLKEGWAEIDWSDVIVAEPGDWD
uniref:Uncharacterized protein n=1 Tax=Leersia perrieri TaxID=77586 RepID=A0A0D9XTY5_9ORYZ